mgnify:CR=1 FL=1
MAAVLDWELSTLGHPLADPAYFAMPYRLGSEWDGFRGKDLEALGIPSEQDFVAAYCRRVGRRDIPDWDWYLIFAMFRLAAIAQGIMGRVIAGTANDPHASQPRRTRPAPRRRRLDHRPNPEVAPGASEESSRAPPTRAEG